MVLRVCQSGWSGESKSGPKDIACSTVGVQIVTKNCPGEVEGGLVQVDGVASAGGRGIVSSLYNGT